VAPGLVNDETPLSFTCPRCGQAAGERFYGPCGTCRAQLRAEQAGGADATPGGGEARQRFEPRMNVVPNHVATKDD
jgi:hypothetical protein